MEAEKGVMEEIRELLSLGMSSREVIDLGYAPGTVYKVQRQLREKKPEVQQTEPTSNETSAREFAEVVRDLQAEIASLQAEVGRLRPTAEVANDLQHQVRDLRSSLNAAMAKLDTERRRSSELFDETVRLRQEAHEANIEKSSLTGYIASRICRWREDYEEYRRRLDGAASGIPLPNICSYRRSA